MKHSKPVDADPLDVALGADLRHNRKAANMSQGQLGAAIGVSFQQIQKYEKGTNRVAVSTLIALCLAMDADPAPMIAKLMRLKRRPK